MNFIHDTILSFIATVFFAILLNVPRRAILVCALIASLGYNIFIFTSPVFGSLLVQYFFAAFIIAACSEISARIMKMPATIFVTAAILPLVPGMGLYQTMLFVVQGNLQEGIQAGATTMLALAAIAIGIAINSIQTQIITRLYKMKYK